MATSWDERNAQKFAQSLRDKSVPKDNPVLLVPKDKDNPTVLTDHQPTDRQTITEGDPSAVLKDNRDKVVPKSTSKKPQKQRSWLKVRLPADQDRALNIVENWRLEKQAAPKVAAAIQLYAAFEAGDIDYVRENHPKIFAALDKASRKRATLSLLESDSNTERESAKSENRNVEPAVEQIAAALQTITGRDRHLNRDVNELALDLHKANYTAQDVEAWYQRCGPHDWRAVKAAQERRVEQPSLKIIRECIGQVRSLPVDEPEGVEEDWNPYAPAADDPVEAWPPQACTVPERIRSWWTAAKDQLSVQLNRATFDAWVKPTDPIHFVGDPRAGGTLYVAVPHHYGKEWIDKHLLTALNKTFDDLLNCEGQTRRRIGEEALFKVEVIVEGDPVPGVSDA
jgi:hypothetical protein